MYFRLYTGEDGMSHLEELDWPKGPEGHAPFQPASAIGFRRDEPGLFMDLHTAPRRTYIMTLSGVAEVDVGDGKVWRFGAGSCF